MDGSWRSYRCQAFEECLLLLNEHLVTSASELVPMLTAIVRIRACSSS